MRIYNDFKENKNLCKHAKKLQKENCIFMAFFDPWKVFSSNSVSIAFYLVQWRTFLRFLTRYFTANSETAYVNKWTMNAIFFWKVV